VKRDRDNDDDSPSTQPSLPPALANAEERLAKIDKMLNSAGKGKNNPQTKTPVMGKDPRKTPR
jgi:hypothetical protein